MLFKHQSQTREWNFTCTIFLILGTYFKTERFGDYNVLSVISKLLTAYFPYKTSEIKAENNEVRHIDEEFTRLYGNKVSHTTLK